MISAKIARISVEFDKNLPNFSKLNFFWGAAAPLSHMHMHIHLLEVVCDNNMLPLDVLTGWPGSVDDSRVLRNSGLYRDAENKFPGDLYLLADGGYPLLRLSEELPDFFLKSYPILLLHATLSFRWLITPFKSNGRLTRREKRFNTALSKLRQTVERAISRLKGRWRKLKYLNHLDLELAV